MEEQKKATRINFRPLLFCALGLAFGVFLYGKIFLVGLLPSDFLFVALFLLLALPPLKRGRVTAMLLLFALFFGFGMLSSHLFTERFVSTAESGNYRLKGTVLSVARKKGYSVIVLGDLSLDGVNYGGKCRILLSETETSPADILLFDAEVRPTGTDGFSYDPYLRNYYAKDIRYQASVGAAEKVGRSKNPFLLLSAKLYDTLSEHMGEEQANLSFALLTGDSGSMDEGLSDTVRRGGIAHIFAVSGLHIGILYGAVYFLGKRLKKFRFLPAFGAALLYCAFCNFTVSSVRAVIMCGALGVRRAFGKKYDMLESVSLAAVITLLFLPQQWYSAGMRLSYGACLGLALFAGTLSRLFTRLKFPRFLGDYLSASLSVQIFTLPILLDAFGYLSVLALALNLFLIPLLPVFFLCTLLCALLALIIPPAAGVFLLFPEGLFSALLFVLSAVDVTLVVEGFSLGAGALVFLIGCVFLSQRVRLKPLARGILFGGLALLFTATVCAENLVLSGCRIDVSSREGETVALVRTKGESVLLIDGEVDLDDCENFLSRTFGGRLTAVVVLSEDIVDGVNVAAFLPADAVLLKEETETGLSQTPLVFGETFEAGGLRFHFLGGNKLFLYAEGCTVEFDFGQGASLGSDLFIGEEDGRYEYHLKEGTIS